MARALSGEKRLSGPRPTIATHAPALRVLVAEDNSVNQHLVLRLLERLGHQVMGVEQGLEVLETLQAAHSQGQRYDVILMDCQMPVLDGY